MCNPYRVAGTLRTMVIAFLLIGPDTAAAEIKPGAKVVTLTAVAVMDGREERIRLEPGTELAVTSVKKKWVGITASGDRGNIRGWVLETDLVAEPGRQLSELIGSNLFEKKPVAKLVEEMDTTKDGRLTLDEFRQGTSLPKLDELNAKLRASRGGGPSLGGLAQFMTAVSGFRGWKQPLTLQQLQQLQSDFRMTGDIRRSRTALELVNREDAATRARRAQALFRWADKNRDGELAVEEVTEALAR